MQDAATATRPFFVEDTTPVCERVRVMSVLASVGALDPGVQRFAQAARDRATHNPASSPAVNTRRVVIQVLRAVQALPYEPGPDDEEWMQPAPWTLARGGECKALSVLFVAACRALGIPARVIWITQGGQPLNHVSAIVGIDGAWCWADASVRGALLCESPYDAIARLGAWHVVGQAAPSGA